MDVGEIGATPASSSTPHRRATLRRWQVSSQRKQVLRLWMWGKSAQKILLAMTGCLWVARRGTRALMSTAPAQRGTTCWMISRVSTSLASPWLPSAVATHNNYGDNFCDGIEELHETFAAAGAKMVGYVDASGYQHEESKSIKGDKFLGLPCGQDNEDDMTEDRVDKWIAQIKSEGMPL